MSFRSPPRPTLLLPVILVLAASALRAQDERFQISGYGNVHYMDHDGLPRLVGVKDPNNLFFQLREFSLFMDFNVAPRVLPHRLSEPVGHQERREDLRVP